MRICFVAPPQRCEPLHRIVVGASHLRIRRSAWLGPGLWDRPLASFEFFAVEIGVEPRRMLWYHASRSGQGGSRTLSGPRGGLGTALVEERA